MNYVINPLEVAAVVLIQKNIRTDLKYLYIKTEEYTGQTFQPHHVQQYKVDTVAVLSLH